MTFIEAIVNKKINFDEVGVCCESMTSGYQSLLIPTQRKKSEKMRPKKDMQRRSKTSTSTSWNPGQWTGISINPLSETVQQFSNSNDMPKQRKERQQPRPNPPSETICPQCRTTYQSRNRCHQPTQSPQTQLTVANKIRRSPSTRRERHIDGLRGR